MKNLVRIFTDKARALFGVQRLRRTCLGLAGLAAIAIAVASCGTVQRTVMAPPSIPGATIVGNENCSQGLDKVVKAFKPGTHGRLNAVGVNGKDFSCASSPV